MSKEILILTIVSLYLVLGMGVISYAGPFKDTANIQEHIKVHLDKVKNKNPQKYQEMMQKTGGKITDCKDCHIEAHQGDLPLKGGMDSKGILKK